MFHLNNASILFTLIIQYLNKQDLQPLDKFSFPIGCILLQHLVYKERKVKKNYGTLNNLPKGKSKLISM